MTRQKNVGNWIWLEAFFSTFLSLFFGLGEHQPTWEKRAYICALSTVGVKHSLNPFKRNFKEAPLALLTRSPPPFPEHVWPEDLEWELEKFLRSLFFRSYADYVQKKESLAAISIFFPSHRALFRYRLLSPSFFYCLGHSKEKNKENGSTKAKNPATPSCVWYHLLGVTIAKPCGLIAKLKNERSTFFFLCWNTCILVFLLIARYSNINSNFTHIIFLINY